MEESFDWFRPEDLPPLFKALSQTSSGGVLIGGQSLTFWVQFFGLPIPKTETPFLTQDVDFYGTGKDAEIVAKALGATLVLPDIGDNTPNTAMVTYITADGRKLLVDFLGSIIGNIPESHIQGTAIILESPDTGRIAVMHPRLVMVSRLANLFTLKHKRDFNGICQARVSIDVVRSFFDWYAEEHVLPDDRERFFLDSCEWIFHQAISDQALLCFKKWEIDVLNALPVERIKNPKFHSTRLPQAVDYINRKRKVDVLKKYLRP